MNPHDERRKHDILHRSLRENLVPISTWYKQMVSTECCGPIEIGIMNTNGDLPFHERPLYTVPYPYNTSILDMMLEYKSKQDNRKYTLKDVANFTGEEIQRWLDLWKTRVDPFTTFAIHDELVAELDADPDIGVIIHGSTGTLWPFQYSQITGFNTIVIPVSLSLWMSRFAQPEKMGIQYSEYQNLVSTFYNHRHEFEMYYTPNFKTENGDMFFNCGDYGQVSNRNYIPHQDTIEIQNHLRIMYESHAKCIVLP